MSILKKTKDFLFGLWGVISATTDSPGTPERSEVTLDAWNELMDKTLAFQAQLTAAKDTFASIEVLTNNKTDYYVMDEIHKLAQDGYGAAKL